jgi:hypothetical protein
MKDDVKIALGVFLPPQKKAGLPRPLKSALKLVSLK